MRSEIRPPPKEMDRFLNKHFNETILIKTNPLNLRRFIKSFFRESTVFGPEKCLNEFICTCSKFIAYAILVQRLISNLDQEYKFGKMNTFGPRSNFKTLNQKCIYVAFQTRDNELFQTLLDQNLGPRVVEVWKLTWIFSKIVTG